MLILDKIKKPEQVEFVISRQAKSQAMNDLAGVLVFNPNKLGYYFRRFIN